QRPDQPWHGEQADSSEDEECRDPNRQRLFSKALGGNPAILLQTCGEERHEGRIEGPLGKEAPEKIGKAEGDEEGVCDRTCAQGCGDQDIAQKAENAAYRGQRSDGRSEEHTSELQSRENLVCRLLLE